MDSANLENLLPSKIFGFTVVSDAYILTLYLYIYIHVATFIYNYIFQIHTYQLVSDFFYYLEDSVQLYSILSYHQLMIINDRVIQCVDVLLCRAFKLPAFDMFTCWDGSCRPLRLALMSSTVAVETGLLASRM